jgi:transitional endoplasmic reticulum ATPase
VTDSPDAAHDLIIAAGKYSDDLHGEIWVYDQGRWFKDSGLWNAIQKSTWDNVILDPDMKKGIRDDINRFFDAQETYKRLGVPWKRGWSF